MNDISLAIISEVVKQNGISLTNLIEQTIKILDHVSSEKTIRNQIKELLKKRYLIKKPNPKNPKGWPLYFIGSKNITIPFENKSYFSDIEKEINSMDDKSTSSFFKKCYFYTLVLMHKYKIYNFILFSESYKNELEKTIVFEDTKRISKIIKDIIKKMKERDSIQSKHVINAIRSIHFDEDEAQFSYMGKHPIFK